MTRTSSGGIVLRPGDARVIDIGGFALLVHADELGAGIAAGMDEADLGAVAERHAMEVVGPVPEGYV